MENLSGEIKSPESFNDKPKSKYYAKNDQIRVDSDESSHDRRRRKHPGNLYGHAE
jgi:hypothetical protein